MSDWNTVEQFEKKVAEFFGAPYGVAVDSCTHGLELCLRYKEAKDIDVPDRTYISIPMLANKIGIKLNWMYDLKWTKYYRLHWEFEYGIYDAATLWEKNSYITNTFMSLSFQYQKHLSLGRGGMILTDNEEAAIQLKKMSYDGRLPGIPWREQNIDTMGYHYYMTPETAAEGLRKLPEAIATAPRLWTSDDYPDLTNMKIFQ